MGFGSYSPSTYMKIKEGAIVVSIAKDNEDDHFDMVSNATKRLEYDTKAGKPMIELCFSFFEGTLISIEKKEVSFNNESFEQWNVKFKDDNDKTYVWTSSYESSSFQGFVNSLSSLPNPGVGTIRLTPYVWQDKTFVSVKFNGNKLTKQYKAEDIPELEPVTRLDTKTKQIVPVLNPKTKKPLLDSSKRMEWVEERVAEINSRLNHYTPSLQDTEVEEDSITEVNF